MKVYRHALTRFWYYIEDDRPVPVKDITASDIQQFIRETLRSASPATASQYFRPLQQFFKWAVTDTVLEDNPMDGALSTARA